MTNKEAVKWLTNLIVDIGKSEYSGLWHYEQALTEIKEMLESNEWVSIGYQLTQTESEKLHQPEPYRSEQDES